MAHPKKHTHESVASDAYKYLSRYEFQLGATGAYRYAWKNGILDQVCSHMPELLKRNSADSVMESAKKYSTKKEFRANDPHGYDYAKRNGLLPLACEHMHELRREHTKQSVIDSAKKFKTVSAFEAGDNCSYQHAKRNDFLAEACLHMERGASGFDLNKKGHLYQIKLTLPCGLTVYKIGITNKSVKVRIRGMGIPDYVAFEITNDIIYSIGSEARSEEKRLHDAGAQLGVRYTGDPFLKNGNTELFMAPLI
jgi:hypothetical protein